MNSQPVSYLQTDSKWANISYATKGEVTTIGASGCGPTAMAMVLATWADKSVTPKSECAWALENGFKALKHGTYYSYFAHAAKRYGLSCTQLNGASILGNSGSGLHAQVLQFLKQGDLIIACMGPGNWTRSGHFVLLWDVIGDVAYVNDPASTLTRRTRGSWTLLKKQVKFYFRIRKPATIPNPKKEESDLTTAEIRKIVEETVKVTVKEYITAALAEAGVDAASAAEPGWSQNEGWWTKAVKAKIIDDDRPESPAKRDEVIAMLGRLGLIPDTKSDPTERAEKLGMD